MNAIVAMLDPTHERRVYDLWEALETTFDVRGIYVTPYPHFTFHGAVKYDLDRLPAMMQRLATICEPFTVQTSGLGIFTGDSPVLFIPVQRTPSLNRIHDRVWHACEPLAVDSSDYYRPSDWIPHITIGFGDMRPDKLASITSFLADRDFNWEFQVDTIALINNAGDAQLLQHRTRLEGQA